VRLLLKPETAAAVPLIGEPPPEAFTGILEAVAAKGFEKEILDYRTAEEALSDRVRARLGVVSFLSVAASLPGSDFFEQAEREAQLVEVVGSRTTLAEPFKRRLGTTSLETESAPTASTVVIALESIVCVGEPQTLARVGQSRPQDTFNNGIALNRPYASALFRSTAGDLPVQELAGLLFATDTGGRPLVFVPDGTLLAMNVKPDKRQYASDQRDDIVEAEFQAGLMRGSQFAKASGRFRFDGEYDAEGVPCVTVLGPLRAEPIADIAAFMAGTAPGAASGPAMPGAAATGLLPGSQPPGPGDFPSGAAPSGAVEIPSERVPGTIAGRPRNPGGGASYPALDGAADNGSGEPFYVLGYSFGGSRTAGVEYRVVQGRDARDEAVKGIEEQGLKVLRPIRSFDDLERAQAYILAQQKRR
jgi:hypothetical protein